MAVKLWNLNKNKDNVQAFFESLVPEYFSQAELADGDTDTGYKVQCTDTEGNLLLEYAVTGSGSSESATVTVHTGCGTDVSASAAAFLPDLGYTCAHGAAICGASKSANSTFMITKNNHGKTVIIRGGTAVSGTAGDQTNHCSAVAVTAWDDVTPFVSLTFTPVTKHQTELNPFASSPNMGETSYTPDAFYMQSASSRSTGIFTADGTDYLSLGYWAIRDE